MIVDMLYLNHSLEGTFCLRFSLALELVPFLLLFAKFSDIHFDLKSFEKTSFQSVECRTCHHIPPT